MINSSSERRRLHLQNAFVLEVPEVSPTLGLLFEEVEDNVG